MPYRNPNPNGYDVHCALLFVGERAADDSGLV